MQNLPAFNVAEWERGLTFDLSHKNWGGHAIKILATKKKTKKRAKPAISVLTNPGDQSRNADDFEYAIRKMEKRVAAGRGPFGDNNMPEDEYESYKKRAAKYEEPVMRSRHGACRRNDNKGLELITQAILDQNRHSELPDNDDDEVYQEEYI